MTKILSIETSTEVCSVALGIDGKLVGLLQKDTGRNHASDLAVFVAEVLNQHDLECSDLDAIAVSAGPGSYTGLRIGASLAKGMAYASGAKLIAIDSLEVIANTAIEEFQAGIVNIEDQDSALLIPMIDARRMEVYAEVFDMQMNKLSPVEALIIDDESFKQYAGRELVLMGDGAAKCVDVINENNPKAWDSKVLSTARGMVTIAQKKFDNNEFVDVAYWEPAYLKDFVVTASKKKFF